MYWSPRDIPDSEIAVEYIKPFDENSPEGQAHMRHEQREAERAAELAAAQQATRSNPTWPFGSENRPT